MKSTNISLKSASARPLGSQNRERSYRYRRLMQVSIRHTYYNASDKLCPDFAVVPTDASATLMASLGMLFRYEGSGFSVLVDEVHLKANFLKYQPAKLVSLLEAESMSGAPASPGDGACWARLSFMLTTNNPMFVNFTDMPIRSAASPATFYLSNIDAYTEKDGDTYLHKGPVLNTASY
jgi:hypothetical protein